jgi:FimV-like protein
MTTVFFAEGCTAPEKGRLLEDYLSGELTEAQAATFEEHYFACPACLEAIRVRQSGPHALVQSNRFATARARYLLGLMAAALVAAAAIFIMWRVGFGVRKDGSSATSLAELARATLPHYVPSAADERDDEPRRQFVEAMRFYGEGDLTRVVPGLEASWKGDPSRPETGYYLGAAFLVTNRVDRAIKTLAATVTLGESPFLDRSKLLLAKAYLRREEIDEARRVLHEVMESNGEVRSEAETLLDGIDRVSRAPR